MDTTRVVFIYLMCFIGHTVVICTIHVHIVWGGNKLMIVEVHVHFDQPELIFTEQKFR